jgi:CRISPR-associated endonuclease/helicase Cas3
VTINVYSRGNIMEYYAKSPTYVLSDNKIKHYCKTIENLIHFEDIQLDKYEKATLENVIKRLCEKKEISHVTLAQHLDDTVHCAEKFFEMYGKYFTDKEKELIIEACRIHDIGKANIVFQSIVNPMLDKFSEKQIPHGFLSTCIVAKKDFLERYPECNEDDFKAFITAVYYHHTRTDDYETEEITKYCKAYYEKYVKEYLNDEEITIKKNRTKLLFYNRSNGNDKGHVNENLWCEYMLIKGMLNKFDWSVSGGYLEAECNADIEQKKLCKKINALLGESLRPAQQYMVQHKTDNVVITAPTGSGKTEAALLWLDGEKGFYTLPLKVSSNAIYNRIKTNYEYEDVTLLHSDSMNVYFEENAEEGYENYQRSRLFSQPLTVCTVDQLFKFVYKALGTEIFAATLKYSKVIIDEIQSYSPRVVASLIFGLSEIKRMGGKFAIITATFPPVLKYFMRKCGLIENTDYMCKDFSADNDSKRHMIEIRKGEMDIEDIVSQSLDKKVLVICNTVSSAQKLYQAIEEYTDNVYLLHSRFIRKHRAILEANIMKFSKDKNTCGIWIATQIVEASLDIDFDILYTEMCTADSLLQRLGRCNRAWRYIPQTANIIIYVNDSGVGSVYKDKDLYDRSLSMLMQYEGKIFTEKDKTEYINAVYDTNAIRDMQYFKDIEKYLNNFIGLAPLEYNKAEADENFRSIDSITVMPDKIYNENQNMLENILDVLTDMPSEYGAKNILKNKLASLTLSLNVYGIFPQNVDKAT